MRVEKVGLALAVYNLGGTFYVTDDACTHGPGLMSEGDIDGENIVCMFHSGAFHIPTGRVTEPPCMAPLATYAVHVVDGNVCIERTPRSAVG
jgi:nitrite reductase/ring-hydroxylating ferredoxin subunit